jgi:REP element-mobilizing transposase RayT
MMIGAHVIFGAYGFWLPNDPRGSWSDFVGAWDLFRYGSATKTATRRSVAGVAHDRIARLATKESLKYPAVTLTGPQIQAVGQGFSEYADKAGLSIWACAILPDHVHLVLGSFRSEIKQVVIQLKGAATRRLETEGLHPMARFPRRNGRVAKAFAVGEWKVFLDTADDIVRAMRYVENNPEKEGLPRQRWSFVRSFDLGRH